MSFLEGMEFSSTWWEAFKCFEQKRDVFFLQPRDLDWVNFSLQVKALKDRQEYLKHNK